MSKKILYVDMDNVLVDFPSGIAQLTPETQKNTRLDWMKIDRNRTVDCTTSVFQLYEHLQIET